MRDRIPNKELRSKTVEKIADLNWQWSGDVARLKDERWSSKMVKWTPRETKRSIGRLPLRWTDEN